MAAFGILLSAVLVLGGVLLRNYVSLNTVRGPLLAGISNLWREFLQSAPEYGRRLESLHRKYGQVVRVGPNTVSVSDPSLVAWIDLSDRGTVNTSFGNDIGTATESSVDPQQYASPHEQRIEQLTSTFLRAVRKQRTINLAVFKLFAADIVQHMCSNDIIQPRASQVPFATDPFIPTESSYVSSFLNSLLLKCPIAMLKHKRNGCLPICGFVPESVKRPNAYQPVAGEYQRSGNVSLVAIGVECMEATFASVFYFLSTHPATLSRIKREIDTIFSMASFSEVLHQTKSYALPYVEAVMKETLRHVMIFDYQHQVPPGGVMVGEYDLPQGTVIQYHADTIRHNSTTYGEDSALFRPERWLLADTTERKRMEEGLIPLRICFRNDSQTRAAWRSLKMIIALVISKFDLQLSCEETPDNTSSTMSCNVLVTFAPRLP